MKRTVPLLRRVLRLLPVTALSFLLCAGQLPYGFAPLALGWLSALPPRAEAFFTIPGLFAGALVFFDFQHGLRFLAAAVLIQAAKLAFQTTKLYGRPRFRPMVTAVALLLVESAYLIARPVTVLVTCLCAAAVAALSTRQFLSEEPRQRRLFLLCALLFSAGRWEWLGFSPGRCLLCGALLYLSRRVPPRQAAAMGLCFGLMLDLTASPEGLFFSAILTVGCTLMALDCRRVAAGALTALTAAALTVLFLPDAVDALLWEAVPGAFFAILPPDRATARRLQEKAEPEAAPPSPLQRSAAALREVYNTLFRDDPPPRPENPAVIFDQAARQVCRDCLLSQRCWQQEYHTTYNAFNDACPRLLQRGSAAAEDFPLYFSSRCVRFSALLSAVSGETRAFLLRQQYRRRLLSARRQAREQYAQLGDLLSGAAAPTAAVCTPMGYRVASALEPRQGETLCGDQMDVFEVGATVYFLLCDGMGSGEGAHAEAATTVHLLRQFLESGIEPAAALRTLNTALTLRSDSTGSFSTIDLMALRRDDGTASLYKYGAAPSYLKRSGAVRRFTGHLLPAGLQNSETLPERTQLTLEPGSFFIMISDGIADEESDEWLQDLLAGWNGQDPHVLTGLVLRECRQRRAQQDDCAVLILYLPGGDSKEI